MADETRRRHDYSLAPGEESLDSSSPAARGQVVHGDRGGRIFELAGGSAPRSGSAALEDRLPPLDEGGHALGRIFAVGESPLGLLELGNRRFLTLEDVEP